MLHVQSQSYNLMGGGAQQSLKPQPFPRPKIWILHTLPQTRPSSFQYTMSLLFA